MQIGIIKKSKHEYWGVLHHGDPRYHFFAVRAGTYKQAWRAAKKKLSELSAQQAGAKPPPTAPPASVEWPEKEKTDDLRDYPAGNRQRASVFCVCL